MDSAETFSLLMDSMIERFSVLDDDQLELQRQRITAQKRWADMEMMALETVMCRFRKDRDDT